MLNLLPNLNSSPLLEGMDPWKVYFLVAEIYLLDTVLVALLCLVCYNIWRVLIKKKGYKVLGMVLFYVLSTTLIVARIFDLTNEFSSDFSMSVRVGAMASFLKIELGLVQIMILVELSI